MTKNVLLCGVGGQGTVLASRLIALAAMEKGMEARGAETIGMAQRGGSVVSHVRIGGEIYSPMIPHKGADVMIGFEPAEAVRCLPYLKKGGCVAVSYTHLDVYKRQARYRVAQITVKTPPVRGHLYHI